MTPEDALAQILTQVFPGSQVDVTRDEARAATRFRLRIIVGAKVWGLTRLVRDEDLCDHFEMEAQMMVKEIRHHMERELGVQGQRPTESWVDEIHDFEEVYEMGSAQPVMTINPFGRATRLTYSTSANSRDGWYDTDQRRRDEARFLELARMEEERQEEEKAKASILDAIAKRAGADPR